MAVPPFKVKSIYEYTSEHDDDLTFPVGQVITVTELEGDEWYVGEYTSVTGEKHDGLFPSNFVEKYEPEVPTRPSRPTKQKQETASPAPAPAPVAAPIAAEPEEEDVAPTPPAAVSQSPVAAPSIARAVEPEARSPPPAPKPTPAEPAEPASTPAKKPPPPVAAKSNAFKDRIAAFNQPAAAPLAPMQPGRQQQPSFIKKPFVAPPPSKSAYIPPAPKAEPVQRPYVREEDPEIKEREEEDRAAAEAAGFGQDAPTNAPANDEDDDAPKPMTLKERMAMLQQQQQEQAQRRAELASKKKPPPQKKASESSDVVAAPDAEEDEIEGVSRQSSELSRDKPRVSSSSQRRPPEPPMSPVPVVPESEILSDGHEADQSGAGDLTEEDDTGTLGPDSDERPADSRRSLEEPAAAEHVEEEEEEDDDEVDEETRRKEELRARMARLGGGMPGMGAPFNPFGAPPPAPSRKKQPARDRDLAEDAPASAPQIPQMVPIPGLPHMQSPVENSKRVSEVEEPEEEDETGQGIPPPPPKRTTTTERGAPPPPPRESRPAPPAAQERGAPPVPSGAPQVPAPESRPVPPPPPGAVTSPGPGSESDDEMSTPAVRSSAEYDGGETPMPVKSGAPPISSPRALPLRPDEKRASYFSGSDAGASEKRTSRVAPPVPGSDPLSRPPPPPPPGQAPLSRQSTGLDGEPDEQLGSDYDGDYDTDIASSAKHKDALKAPHYREASLTEIETTPVNSPPPLPPQASAPRSVPPPPPPQSAPKPRQSMDRPPPPVPPPREDDVDEEYDPYRYNGNPGSPPAVPIVAPGGAPPLPPQRALPPEPAEGPADDLQSMSPPTRRSTDRAPTAMASALGGGLGPPGRASTDLQRNSSSAARRSVEHTRPSGEHGQMAGDINLSTDTPWWTADRPLPPALQDRNGIDILSECEETSKSKRGGKKEITKDIYILYMDYSQTVISARYDSADPMDVQLEQRHEPPPPRLRQDQLEAAWQQFGSKISETANSLGHSKKDNTIGDPSSPFSLPLELIKAQPNALLPVGTRAYGALVYANLANASTMQYDEIRRGDIITLRNARFEGHQGAIKTKYKADYGPGHVAVVEEWDGTRRAVRAWEQGREKKGGVRSEKFRLGDLRSGEVRVWRVVGRDWVGWDS